VSSGKTSLKANSEKLVSITLDQIEFVEKELEKEKFNHSELSE
jgi:hypothetical protein